MSIVNIKACEPHTNILPVQYQPPGNVTKNDFHVCVSPLQNHYNNVTFFVEAVEINVMFGANKLVIYNFSIGNDMDSILDYYVKKGKIDVVQWPLPLTSFDGQPLRQDFKVYYYGQLLALNDCLYRNMYRTEHIVVTDIDEKIVPRIPNHRTWKDIFKIINRNNSIQYCSILFRNTFFRTDWQQEPLAKNHFIKAAGLVSLLTTKRELLIDKPRHRSKYIANTNDVLVLGIHEPWKCLSGKHKVSFIPKEMGLVHHYRHWDNSPDRNINSLHDNRMFFFANDLVHRIYKRYLDMNMEGLHVVTISHKLKLPISKLWDKHSFSNNTFDLTSKP